MIPLKETEVGEAPASQGTNRPKPDSGHLRSDAVSLDVPVKVHGSRVVEVVRGTTSHTEPFEEQTSTMIVFPLGGVLKMITQVSVGQAIVLTNLKTRQDAICRVVKTRTNPNLHSYVEVEFSHPQPGYWGVRFPSDGPEPPQKTAPPAATAPARVTPAPVAAPVSTPAPRVEIPKAEIPKIQTNEQKTAPPAPVASSVVEKPASASTPPSASFSLEQLRGDSGSASALQFPSTERVKEAEPHQTETHREEESSASHESPAAHEPSTFGRFTASSADHAPARPAFGAGLEYSPLGTADKHSKEGKSGALIAICAGLLVAAAAGGGYYFVHHRPATQRAAVASLAAPQAPVVPTNPVSNPVAENPAPVQQTPVAVPAVAAPVATPPVQPRPRQRVSEVVPSKTVPSPPQPRTPESAKQKSAPAVPDMFGALNAHPTTAVRAGNADSGSAPSIDTGALAGGQGVALPSTELSPTNLLPPPSQPVSDAPVRVGGEIKPPQLISSPAVVYPEIAHQAGIAGDVVVRIVIDKSGNVTEAKVISGPALLRDAAVSALRGRKYVPSKLDGHPISIEMLVTIQFHR
jgi:periplasmic protein TonB